MRARVRPVWPKDALREIHSFDKNRYTVNGTIPGRIVSSDGFFFLALLPSGQDML